MLSLTLSTLRKIETSSHSQICADESIMQMTTRRALVALDAFNKAPSQEQASCLVDIPALHALLAYELRTTNGTLSPLILDICVWIHNRGMDVLTKLTARHPPLAVVDEPLPRGNWEVVSSWFVPEPDACNDLDISLVAVMDYLNGGFDQATQSSSTISGVTRVEKGGRSAPNFFRRMESNV